MSADSGGPAAKVAFLSRLRALAFGPGVSFYAVGGVVRDEGPRGTPGAENFHGRVP